MNLKNSKFLILVIVIFGFSLFLCTKFIPSEHEFHIITKLSSVDDEYVLTLDDDTTLNLSHFINVELQRKNNDDNSVSYVTYQDFLDDLDSYQISISSDFFNSYVYKINTEEPSCCSRIMPSIYFDLDSMTVKINPFDLYPIQNTIWVSNDYKNLVYTADDADSNYFIIKLTALDETIPVTSESCGEELVLLLNRYIDTLYPVTSVKDLLVTDSSEEYPDAEYEYSPNLESCPVSIDCTTENFSVSNDSTDDEFDYEGG